MKILHIFKSAAPDSFGGIEKVIDEMTSTNLNINIILALTNNTEKILNYKGNKVILIKQLFSIASTPFSFKLFRVYKQLINEVDIIHFHFPYPLMDLLCLFNYKNNKPIVITYHSDIIRQKFLYYIYKPIMLLFLYKSSVIITTSTNYFKSSPVLKLFKSKVVVIPIGLSISSYGHPSSSDIDYWKNIFNFKYFIFVGVLRYYKGLEILIKSASLVPHIPIVILGSGKMEKMLYSLVNKLKINNIYLLGELNDDDKKTLIYLSTGVIFPSNLRSEAFGISLLEGAIYSKPLISCEIGTGTSFININNLTGLVVKPYDVNELADSLNTIYENPCLASKLGKNAYYRYEEFFTSNSMNNMYQKVYENLIIDKSFYINKN